MLFECFNGKKILVTGHTGFKGSWLSLWLKNLGANIVGYSIDIPTQPSHFEAINLKEKIIDIRGDICDAQHLNDVFKTHQPEIVFHLAARPIVRDCYENPKRAFETNVMGTLNILEALRSSPSTKAAVLITSDKCYENVEWEYGYRENDQLGGADPYSATKACAEILISSYFRSYFKNSNSKSSCHLASVRAGNVIGGGDWAQDRIVPDAIKSWSQNLPLNIRNPNSTRPWQLVLEPLSGYLTLAAHLFLRTSPETLNGESFNFGPKSEVVQPVSELIQEMKKIWTYGNVQIDSPSPNTHANIKKEANLLKLCCDKAQARLKWNAILNFEETIKMTAKWYFDYYQNEGVLPSSEQQIHLYQNLAKERGLPWAN